ncbi:MAG: response regulator [Myxococcales bacterium]|jgi:DNA-binding NarL/FixJ family response regulator
MSSAAQQHVEPRPASILVVDDDPAFRRYAERVLTVGNHRCTLASSADEARALLGRTRFDLLVTDIQLGDGNGLDLLRHVSLECGFLPVIVVTGFPTVATAVDALRLEAVDYVTKPAPDLEECVSRALEKAKRRRQSEELGEKHRIWSRSLRELADQLERDLGGQGDATPWLPAFPAGRADETRAEETSPEPVGDSGTSERWSLLTRREADVARMLIDGLGPPQISERLGISISTVRNHLQSAFRKIGARSQVELIARLTRA